jgi:hypothetical protein
VQEAAKKKKKPVWLHNSEHASRVQTFLYPAWQKAFFYEAWVGSWLQNFDSL